LWAKGSADIHADRGNSIAIDAFGNIYLTGQFSNTINFEGTALTSAGGSDVFIAKIEATAVDVGEFFISTSSPVNPNPFSSSATIQLNTIVKQGYLNIYNINGQLVQEKKNISGNLLTLSRENLVSGLYFFMLKENNTIITSNKFVITD
jgi:hypothetical protein